MLSCEAINDKHEQPNILIVVLDACRADHVGCYGYGRNTTPNIDAFARKAILYRNAYSNCSWTKPSVTSLLTGLDCREHGVQAGFDTLAEDLPYLPAELQPRGYTTGAFIHSGFLLKDKGYARGVDRFWHLFPSLKSNTDLITNEVVVDPDDAVLVNQVIPFTRNTDQPWFAYVHLMGPHTPYRAYLEAEYFGKTNLDLYDGKLRYADAQIGRLLATVPSNTIVIITADHGEEFGEHGGAFHGNTLYDEVVHIPLLIRWPGYTARVEQGLVGLDRISPALLSGCLPETGGEVQCHLERGWLASGRLTKRLHRVVTSADIQTNTAPAVDAETLRREQLEALGYF
jgi:arylsulfatase A-like enzyme